MTWMEHGLQVSLKRYALSVEIKMAAGAFGRARNYGREVPDGSNLDQECLAWRSPNKCSLFWGCCSSRMMGIISQWNYHLFPASHMQSTDFLLFFFKAFPFWIHLIHNDDGRPTFKPITKKYIFNPITRKTYNPAKCHSYRPKGCEIWGIPRHLHHKNEEQGNLPVLVAPFDVYFCILTIRQRIWPRSCGGRVLRATRRTGLLCSGSD